MRLDLLLGPHLFFYDRIHFFFNHPNTRKKAPQKKQAQCAISAKKPTADVLRFFHYMVCIFNVSMGLSPSVIVFQFYGFLSPGVNLHMYLLLPLPMSPDCSLLYTYWSLSAHEPVFVSKCLSACDT